MLSLGWGAVVRRPVVASVVLMLAVVLALGAAIVGQNEPPQVDSPEPAATTTVQRQDLTQSETINGTVGKGAAFGLPIQANGIVTWAPKSGKKLAGGDVILRVDNRPITLAQGKMPLYRELRLVSEGERDAAGERLGAQSGRDVTQLQRFLRRAGFRDNGQLKVDGKFGASTARAVKAWQRSVGHPATGRIDRSQLICTDGEVIVEGSPSVGAQFTEITVTPTTTTVTATATTGQRSFFAKGRAVTIKVGKKEVSARVEAATNSTNESGKTQYRIEIPLGNTKLPKNTQQVTVSAVKKIKADTLTVPVRALVALGEGGWAVEVPASSGVELRAVEVGEIVDGQAEVTGIAEGTSVVVPS